MPAVATVDRGPLTAALQAVIAAVGTTCEVVRPPINAADLMEQGLHYVILHPLDGGGFNGPPMLPESDATFAYQTTCVGLRGDQVEALNDLVRRAMKTAALSVSGLTIIDRWCESAGGIDADTTLLSLPERHYFSVTSS